MDMSRNLQPWSFYQMDLQHLKPEYKWFLGLAVVVGAYALYVRAQNAASGTSATPNQTVTPAAGGSGYTTSTGVDTSTISSALQSFATQDSGLFNQLGQQINTNDLALSTAMNQIGTANATDLQALATAEGAAFQSVGNYLSKSAVSLPALGQGLVQIQGQDTAVAQQVSGLQSQIQTGFKAIIDFLSTSPASLPALGQGLVQVQGQLMGQTTLLQQLITTVQGMTTTLDTELKTQLVGIQNSVNSLQSLTSDTAISRDSSYYLIGKNSGAGCIADDGNVSVSCLETAGELDAGHADNNPGLASQNIRAKYSSCSHGGSAGKWGFDLVCVGKQIAQANNIGSPSVSGGGVTR